jgi:hypothetical protein
VSDRPPRRISSRTCKFDAASSQYLSLTWGRSHKRYVGDHQDVHAGLGPLLNIGGGGTGRTPEPIQRKSVLVEDFVLIGCSSQIMDRESRNVKTREVSENAVVVAPALVVRQADGRTLDKATFNPLVWIPPDGHNPIS